MVVGHMSGLVGLKADFGQVDFIFTLCWFQVEVRLKTGYGQFGGRFRACSGQVHFRFEAA